MNSVIIDNFAEFLDECLSSTPETAKQSSLSQSSLQLNLSKQSRTKWEPRIIREHLEVYSQKKLQLLPFVRLAKIAVQDIAQVTSKIAAQGKIKDYYFYHRFVHLVG
jgi:adenylate kinase family enzyme